MTLEGLKKEITDNTFDRRFIIFKCTDNNFIAKSYIKRLCDNNKLELSQVDTIEDLFDCSSNMFKVGDEVYLYEVDKFDSCYEELNTLTNSFVVCNKITKEAEELFKNSIVTIPKLEQWQIKDYVYTFAEGVDKAKLDELIDICKYDIYRLSNEISKLSLFSIDERKVFFDSFVKDGVFSDLSKYSVFNLSNAIIKKDIKELRAVYSELSKIDVDPFGLLSILITNFRNIISVQLGNNPSPETCGINPKQFWAIKYSCGYYTKEQLIDIYKLLTSIDLKIKTGDMPTQIVIDYLITHILSI